MVLGSVVLAVSLVVTQAPVESAPRTDEQEVEKPRSAQSSHPGVWLPIVAGLGTAAAVLAPALVAAGVIAVGVNVGAGFLSTEAVLWTLLLGLVTPFVFALLVVPGILGGPVLSFVLSMLVGRWRVPMIPALVLGILSGALGLLLGAVIHEAGIAVGLAMLWIAYVFVVILEAVLGAFCAALCGSSSSDRVQTQLTDIRVGPGDRPTVMAIMGVWAASLVVPTAIGSAVGCLAGNLAGVALGRARGPRESTVNLDLLEVPDEENEEN